MKRFRLKYLDLAYNWTISNGQRGGIPATASYRSRVRRAYETVRLYLAEHPEVQRGDTSGRWATEEMIAGQTILKEFGGRIHLGGDYGRLGAVLNLIRVIRLAEADRGETSAVDDGPVILKFPGLPT